MKSRMDRPARGCFLLLSAGCVLLVLALVILVQEIRSSPPYQPAVVRVTGARAEQTELGCLVTLSLENRSSTAASLTADDFYLYDAGNNPLYELREISYYTSPFVSGWEVSLPAGRSGSLQLLVAPPEGDALTVYWYEGDEGYELTFSIE